MPTTWLFLLFQFECGGMVLEEAPDKLAESFRLFLQGMGHSTYIKHIDKDQLGVSLITNSSSCHGDDVTQNVSAACGMMINHCC